MCCYVHELLLHCKSVTSKCVFLINPLASSAVVEDFSIIIVKCWLLIFKSEILILKWASIIDLHVILSSPCSCYDFPALASIQRRWDSVYYCLNYLGPPEGQNCNLFGSQINQSAARCSHTYSLVYKTAKKYFHTVIRNYKTHYDDTKTWCQTKRHIRQQDQ